MKPLDHQNHYEALEVGSGASADEIERAYRLVRAAYADDSLALYSIFDEADASAVRERIEHAFHVLSDPVSRRQYDGRLELDSHPPVEDPAPAPGPAALEPVETLQEIEDEEDGNDFDGARLRRARLRRGIEIDQVAAVTKISATYLRYLEEECFDDLPAAVYVRGFVGAYARAIGLEPASVTASYLARLDEVRSTKKPSRLLGRR